MKAFLIAGLILIMFFTSFAQEADTNPIFRCKADEITEMIDVTKPVTLEIQRLAKVYTGGEVTADDVGKAVTLQLQWLDETRDAMPRCAASYEVMAQIDSLTAALAGTLTWKFLGTDVVAVQYDALLRKTAQESTDFYNEIGNSFAASVEVTSTPRPVATIHRTSVPVSTLPPSSNSVGGSCPMANPTCGQLSSCAQARACLAAGYSSLDRDHDGVPCESLCN